MTFMIVGLVLFLGVHSVRIFAEPWRTATLARIGEKTWKLAYTAVSLVGFGLLVWGYGQARLATSVLWGPPVAMRHIAGLLMLLSFILLVAAYVPANGIKARVHHPMVLAVKVWALAHLLANGTLADVVLFGSFLVWAVLNFRAARRRDRAAGTVYPAGTKQGTAIAVVVGIGAWLLMAFWLHGVLIGVKPFGR